MKSKLKLCLIFVIIINNVSPIYSDTNYTSILEQVPKWKNTNLTAENTYIMEQKLKNHQKLIDNVAYRGDGQKDYRITLRDLNLLTRKHYSEMINHIGYHIFPLLVATDVDHDKRLSGVGSEFILFLKNGTIRTAKPSPSSYELNKDLSHISVGIFAIISPFFNNPTSPMWHDKLREYQTYLQNSLKFFDGIAQAPTSYSVNCDQNLSNQEQIQMLTIANNYITNCFKNNSVDYHEYLKFAEDSKKLIHKAVKCSAKIQVMSTIRQLKIWKEQLGEEWDDLYVLIPVIWPVARTNPRRQIIELFMSEEKRMTNIIMAEGAKTIHEARELLGRVISDRTMSEMVYKHDNPKNIEQNVALSTRTDMVTPSTEEVLNEINVTAIQLSDPYDEPNDIRFDDFYQVPVY